MNQATLLIVDDEVDNLDALERIFRKRYRLLKAKSGSEALNILKENPHIDVIISDQRMPQMTGVEFFEKTLVTHSKSVRILLTGYTDIDSIIAAVNKGHIFRYLTKPWDTTDLTNSVEQAMDYYSRGVQLEIKNKDLEKALLELKSIDLLKSKFMILINHELKTPITVISSFLELLLETQTTEEQKVYLDRIKKSLDRLKEIVDDTLILIQHAAGVLKLEQKQTSINDLIKQIVNTPFNQSELHKKGIKIQINLSENPTTLPLLDSNYIHRVLNHLIANAIRFSYPNSEIKIETHLILSSSGQNVIIENEGPLIPTIVIERLSVPFKLQEEIMNHSKGLGLGISVVEALLQLHHSQLKIENAFQAEDPKSKSVVRASFQISNK